MSDVQHAGAASAGADSNRRKRRPLSLHRCRFPDFSPTAISALAITPPTFDSQLLGCGGVSAERGVLGVGRANGDVELMVWGGQQGWISWRTLPCSFPISKLTNSKKPTSLLSHLLFTHQTTLSTSDLTLYDGDVEAAQMEVNRYQREGVRLFGVGGVASELVEWEWGGPGSGKEIGRVKSTLPTLPPIFALAASRASSQLAIGCEDSTIRILNILDDELELISKIEVGGPGKVRALSLAWGPPIAAVVSKGKGREDSPDVSSLPAHFATPTDPYLIAGCSNSSIHRFDAPASGSSAGVWRGIQKMTVDRLKGEQTVVWTCAVLGDGTVVSGDSMGNIKFFDGEMGTQLQSFKTHKADVLCIAVGSDGTSVFTSGVDQKTSEFRLVSVSNSRFKAAGSAARWIQASGRRLHSHDVKAMIMSPPFLFPLPSPSPTSSSSRPSPQVPILTSGGLDLGLVIVAASTASPSKRGIPLKNPVSDTISTEFETTIHRRTSFVPQRSRPFAIATQARLLVCRRERSIGIWSLAETAKGSSSGGVNGGWKRRDKFTNGGFGAGAEEGEEEEIEETPGWSKFVEMELKLQTNLIASAVSPDGRWLAVSDLYETKLFRLVTKNAQISPRRQKTFSTSLSAALPPSLGTGSSSIVFSNDSKRLILGTSFGGTIAVVELPIGGRGEEEEGFQVVGVFSEHSRSEGGREIRGKDGKDVNGDVEMGGEDDEEEETPSTGYGTRADKPATVVCLAVSGDGKWLASADLERKVCIFDLEKLSHYTTLPTPSHIPAALAFLPTSTAEDAEPTLLIALPTNALSLFGLTTLRFLAWSLPLSSLTANTMMDIREPVLGVTFEPREQSSSALNGRVHESRRSILAANESMTAVVWGANWVSKIDLDEIKAGLYAPGKAAPVRREADKKRARDQEQVLGETTTEKVDIRTTRRYQPLMMLGFLGNGAGNELIAVERTWFDLAKALPEAWVKSGQFGS